MSNFPPFHFAVPVWGESYVSTYLNFCLPAQLAPRNIPFLRSHSEHKYTIYTTLADHACITASPAFHSLRKVISVEIQYIDAALNGGGNKYLVKSDCYRQALENAGKCGAVVVALNADVLLANGFVQETEKLISRGKRVIEVAGPRGLRNHIINVLSADYKSSDGTCISIEPRELSSLWLRNMHPQLQMHFVEGPQGAPFHPSHLYWAVGSEGVIIRGFHLYPIVIYQGGRKATFSSTIDDDLVGNLRFSAKERFLAQDSRDLFCCELSPEGYHVDQVAARGDLDRYVEFYCSYAEQNISNLRREIVITGASTLGAEWDIRRRQSAIFVQVLIRKCWTVRGHERVRQTILRVKDVIPLRGFSPLSIFIPLRFVIRIIRVAISRASKLFISKK